MSAITAQIALTSTISSALPVACRRVNSFTAAASGASIANAQATWKAACKPPGSSLSARRSARDGIPSLCRSGSVAIRCSRSDAAP